MTTIAQLMHETTPPSLRRGVEEQPYLHRVGLEFEYEDAYTAFTFTHNDPLQFAPSIPYWDTTHDGSLRAGGVEYVLSEPCGPLRLTKALRSLEEALPGNVNPSWRCSTHVHVDVRDMTIPQLKQLIAISIIFETALFRVSGGRKTSNYCLAERDIYSHNSAAVVNNCADDNVIGLLCSGSKYRALNTGSVAARGSLEYRHHVACGSPREILPWVRILLAMKEWAINGGDWQALCSTFERRQWSGVLKVFGAEVERIMPHMDIDDLDASCNLMLSYKAGRRPSASTDCALVRWVAEQNRGEQAPQLDATTPNATLAEHVRAMFNEINSRR